MNIKVLLKALPGIFEHVDKNVRAEVRHRHMLSYIRAICIHLTQAKVLTVELFRWIGAAIKPSLEGKIKPVQVCAVHKYTCAFHVWCLVSWLSFFFHQMKELEEEFGKVTGGPAVPSRLLRSQQQAAASAPSAAVDTGGGGGGEEEV